MYRVLAADIIDKAYKIGLIMHLWSSNLTNMVVNENLQNVRQLISDKRNFYLHSLIIRL